MERPDLRVAEPLTCILGDHLAQWVPVGHAVGRDRTGVHPRLVVDLPQVTLAEGRPPEALEIPPGLIPPVTGACTTKL